MSQIQAEEDPGFKEVMPDAAGFQAVKKGQEVEYYRAVDKVNKMIGVVFKASAKGYSSAIDTLVGMLNDGTITAIKVTSQNETPGLGGRVSESDFAGRFAKKKIDKLGEVQAITGATVSSNAVIAAVKAKAEEIKALLQNGQ
ncbi:MAG: FMN-binding protein [Candidatus Omnitrophica bacterium]|nr:FMN-binding protein [Candidatus Omnitrophota bacterium]